MDSVIGDSPFAIFKRRHSETEFELQSVLGMKVAATVAAHDFELSIDGFDDVGCGKGFSHVLGVF